MPAKRVPHPLIPPRNAVGYLVSKWNDDSFVYGTASMIGPRYLLTCSHNLVAKNKPDHATESVFHPGCNQPVGQEPPTGGLTVHTAFYSNAFFGGDDAWDVAVCYLDNPVQPAPEFFFSPRVSLFNVRDRPTVLTSYPGDNNRAPGEMWEDSDGEVTEIDPGINFMIHTHDTGQGSSGAPIWSRDIDEDAILQHAVHVARLDENRRRAILLTQPVCTWIKFALADPIPTTPGSISAVADRTLRMPAPKPPEIQQPPPLRFGLYGSEACVYLIAAGNVAWTAALSGGGGWLSIASGAAGTGDGLITLKAEQSTGPERSGSLTITDATGRTLLECAAIQATAETLATLNTSVLQVPFPTVPDVMEIGILGKWAAEQIAKVPEPFTGIVLAIALLVVQLIGALAIALRSAVSPLVPEPLTWFGAPGLYDAMTKVLPATAVFIQEETDLLTLYLPIQVAKDG